ncbi:MAG: VOC family protein [Acidimicrobiales bacterium]
MVECQDQAEIDYYWDALLAAGGTESRCGWLKDRFGVSWQVVSPRLGELLRSTDADQAQRAFDAMMTMAKIDLAVIEAAAKGASNE